MIYDIHPEDEMKLYLESLGRTPEAAFAEYMNTGFSIYTTIRVVLERLGRPLSELGSLLDFASGHGRATRFLAQGLPADSITISDLYETAVNFQRERFGVRAFLSKDDPDELAIPERYPAVTCISLFTHLPEKLFERWLVKLVGACTDDGLFLFTTHGIDLLGGLRAKRKDFVFIPESESRSLDTEIYGSTYVSHSYVEALVEAKCPGRKVIAYAPKGLHYHQDVYVVGATDEPEREIGSIVLPHLFLEALHLVDDHVYFHGWACSLPDHHPVTRVQVSVNEKHVCDGVLGKERPDVAEHFGSENALNAGLEGRFPFTDDMAGGVLTVEVIDPEGLRSRHHRRLQF